MRRSSHDCAMSRVGGGAICHGRRLKRSTSSTALKERQRLLTNHTQERAVIPGCNRDEVMQRLMSSANVTGIDASRDRLDAFTFASQEQAGDVVAQRLYAIGMIKFFAQQGQVIFKTLCTSFQRRGGTFHHPMSSNFLRN